MADDARDRGPLLLGSVLGAWNPYYPSPPVEPSFVIAARYVTPRKGEEAQSRFIPLVFDEVRVDIPRLVPIKVSRAAIEKVGPLYRGVIDSEGKPFLFSMSGDGIHTKPVQKGARDKAWRAFERLLDAEYELSVELRRRTSNGTAV